MARSFFIVLFERTGGPSIDPILHTFEKVTCQTPGPQAVQPTALYITMGTIEELGTSPVRLLEVMSVR